MFWPLFNIGWELQKQLVQFSGHDCPNAILVKVKPRTVYGHQCLGLIHQKECPNNWKMQNSGTTIRTEAWTLKLCCQILTFHLGQFSLWILHRNVRWSLQWHSEWCSKRDECHCHLNRMLWRYFCRGAKRRKVNQCVCRFKKFKGVCFIFCCEKVIIFLYTTLWMNNDIVISGKYHVSINWLYACQLPLN